MCSSTFDSPKVRHVCKCFIGQKWGREMQLTHHGERTGVRGALPSIRYWCHDKAGGTGCSHGNPVLGNLCSSVQGAL